MAIVQISDAGGLSYQNGSIHSLAGVLVRDGINGSEVSPGTYSFNFGTIPDGDYSFSASINGQLAFAERVTISEARAINPVASQDSVPLAGLAQSILGTDPTNSPLVSQLEREDGPLDRTRKYEPTTVTDTTDPSPLNHTSRTFNEQPVA